MMIDTMITPTLAYVNQFITQQFQSIGQHQKQSESLVDAVLGLLESKSLMPSEMGRGLARAKQCHIKHSIKQIDRTAHNDKIQTKYCESQLAKFLIGQRSRIVVAMDWTVFAKDKHMTITLRLITRHGRATPLLWNTVPTEDLKGKKSQYVFSLLEKLRCLVPQSCQVIILGDREFGTLRNMKKLTDELNFDYIFRVKRNFTVKDSGGVSKLAHAWLDEEQATCIDNAKVTVQEYGVKKVVICKEKNMKDMWVLVASTNNLAIQTIMNYYGKRWGTETSYRDEKDLQYGLGMKKARMASTEKRDRLFLISAIAIIILTLLGAASEAVGYDKYIKANTTKKRTHSLFNQGKILWGMLGRMKLDWQEKLIQAFKNYCYLAINIRDEQFVI